MNALNLISSTLALGAIMGISGTHFHQVKTMAAPQVGSIMAPVETPSLSDEEGAPAPQQAISLTQATKKLPPMTVAKNASVLKTQASLNERETALMEILREIREDQKNIRSQVSETNRDMDELTFRVDSHSTQFRPLQTKSSRPHALIIQEDPGVDQLLPPKP